MIDQTTPLFAEQLALEEEMRSLGVERYWQQVKDAKDEGREAATGPAKRLMGHAHLQMAEALNAFLAECASGKAGRRADAYSTLKDVDVDLACHLTIRAVLDTVSQRRSLLSCAMSAAVLIEDELHYRAFKEQRFFSYKKALKAAKNSPSTAYKRRRMRASARKTETAFTDWTSRQRATVGMKLVELFIASTGLARVTMEYEKSDRRNVIEATPDTLAWLEEEHKRQAWLSPLYMPTIVPPKPWTTPRSGGYWSGRVRRLALVKTRSQDYLDGLAKIEMPEVYSAINSVQETAWRINPRVLEVMEDMWDRGLHFGAIPEAQDTPLPARPFWLTEEMTRETMTEPQLAEFVAWKRETKSTYEVNARTTAKRIQFVRMKWVAAKFVSRDAIYFPHQLDFRGRVYPVTLYLHPQGNDSARGLLMFSEAQPIGNEEGVKWLASHGAGCWGVDKVSFADRLAWVKTNEKHILASAADPIENRFWTTAEKPWQALAFCFEWAGYVREGLAYRSHLPVQMDGTCNGLQNFSALLLDPVGGQAVNLLPGPKPSDIYQSVANVVAARVERDAASGDEAVAALAQGWLGKVTRKVCKRPVMTLAYGAKRFGFKEQVFVDTLKEWKQTDPATFPFEGDGWAAAEYMGACIWDAVGEVVVAAKHAMDWLVEAAREVSKAKQPLIWKTPVGFVAAQRYIVPNMKRLQLAFGDAQIRVSLDDGSSDKLDARKQASGISPNVVHSLDAAHLMRTVNRARSMGITSFSFIHDSYGCHASMAGLMAQALREEFVRMYSEQDVLAGLKTDFEDAAGCELPPLPPRGALDLSKVIESPYFFA